MRRSLPFSRTRHATVVAYLALFTGLSGGAYAAATITGADIVDATVEGIDLKNGSVTGADLGDGSLTGLDVANGSIAAADLKPGTLGMGEVKTYMKETAVDSSQVKAAQAHCPQGWQAISGGAGVQAADGMVPEFGIVHSRLHQLSVFPPISGWYAEAAEHGPTNRDWKVYVTVNCVQKAS